MFRASPWITYDPDTTTSEPPVRSNIHFYNMNDDIEMDAPQISTLPEEQTPEPQPIPSRTSKFRVKLLVNENKRATPSTTNARKAVPHVPSEDEDDEDDEEDQLIDDDDDDARSTVAPPSSAGPSTRTISAKRGQGRTRGGVNRKKNARAGAPDPGPIMTWFEAAPSDNSASATPGLQGEQPWDASNMAIMPSLAASARKKGPPAKGVTAQRAIRKRSSKAVKSSVALLRDDAGSISEAYGGTAASSPAPHDDHTPDPDMPIPLVASTLPMEEINLEGIPLPSYPLPTKPFPVQPPPKIGTGFAPVIPLDKSRKKVRRWRQANREIRGIAGGRWFAHSWVGDKESDFSAAAVAASAAILQASHAAAMQESDRTAQVMAGIPKLSAMSSGKGLTKSKSLKGEAGLSTVTSSRSESVVPQDSVSTQKPSKKRSHAMATEIPSMSPPV